MRPRRGARPGFPGVVVLLAAASLAAASGACGRKGPPVAPERRLPQPAADLTAVVREEAVELSWRNPERRVDATRLRDLAVARVFRLEDEGTGEPRPALLVRDRIPGYAEIATIPLESAEIVDGRMLYTDRRGLARGRRYTYAVVTADAQGRTSAPSPRATVTFIAAPRAPVGLAAAAGDREARLTWRPPAALVDGTAATMPFAYEILRATSATAAPAPVGRTMPGVTEIVDRGLQNDQAYYYAVRAIRTAAGATAFGAASDRVAVTPLDTTPPAAPSGLVAIPSAGAVRLSWNPSPDADVAVYVVYRAGAGADFARVGSTRPPTAVFTDRDVAPGTYRYVVTAQDAGSHPNESSRSNVVTVTVP